MKKTIAKAKPKEEKKTPPKKKTGKKKDVMYIDWDINSALTMNEELFCRYYVLNEETRRNGTRSYDMAYEKHLEEKSKDDAIWETDEDGNKIKLIQGSSYDRCATLCSAEATKLLKKPRIATRITELLNEMLSDKFVDGELAKVIAQDDDLPPKVRAIAEYNKLKMRTTASTVTHNFGNIDPNTSDMDLEKAMEIIQKQTKFFKKE